MKKIILVAFVIGMQGCSSQSVHKADMANPASVYCVKQNGKLDIIKEAGGEVGYCTLQSGERIEEWSLFHHGRSK
ncbi:DUF333 domain-containing protein [Enterobacter asburiae]|uniref:putative hemolysin n=1 Tax=Enterobacter asburiae TaxID=61645 RepID=UPI0021CB14F2|nr:DUF333 domain-containing protein [Enterobacter asburiae]